MPQSMGCLFWQYNDCWPVASWASIDYYGRWKALHYAARHFYAPLMVSGLEDNDTKTVAIFLTSDMSQPQAGTVSWRVTDLQGGLPPETELPINVNLAPQKSFIAQKLDLTTLAQQHGENNLLVWLNLNVNDQEVSRNLVTFARPKDLNFSDPEIKTQTTKTKSGFRVQLTATKPALWAWLNLGDVDVRYSDNFIHLDSHLPHAEIDVTPSTALSHSKFKRALVVRSLFDTYAPHV